MSPKHKILAIKLSEKIVRKQSYAESIGIEIKKSSEKEKSN